MFRMKTKWERLGIITLFLIAISVMNSQPSQSHLVSVSRPLFYRFSSAQYNLSSLLQSMTLMSIVCLRLICSSFPTRSSRTAIAVLRSILSPVLGLSSTKLPPWNCSPMSKHSFIALSLISIHPPPEEEDSLPRFRYLIGYPSLQLKLMLYFQVLLTSWLVNILHSLLSLQCDISGESGFVGHVSDVLPCCEAILQDNLS